MTLVIFELFEFCLEHTKSLKTEINTTYVCTGLDLDILNWAFL